MTVDEAFLVINHPSTHSPRMITRAASVVADEWLRLRRENTTLRSGMTELRRELDELQIEVDEVCEVLDQALARTVQA